MRVCCAFLHLLLTPAFLHAALPSSKLTELNADFKQDAPLLFSRSASTLSSYESNLRAYVIKPLITYPRTTIFLGWSIAGILGYNAQQGAWNGCGLVTLAYACEAFWILREDELL